MRRILLVAVLVAFSGCLRTPGEHEEQASVMFQTPTYDPLSSAPVQDVQLRMMAEILGAGESVDLTVNEWKEFEEFEEKLQMAGVDTGKLFGRIVEHTDIWARDNFPLFSKIERRPDQWHRALADLGLSPAQNAIALERFKHIDLSYTGEFAIDFEFDGWGYGPFSPPETAELYEIDNQIVPTIAAQEGIPVVSSPLIAEGGGIESNGAGTIIYALKAFTQRQAYHPTGPNGQPMTQQQITDELAALFGTPHVIAVPFWHPLDGHSVLDGPLYLDVDGDGVKDPLHMPFTVRHTDELLRFADEHTILIAQLPGKYVGNDIEQEIHDRLEDVWAFMEEQVDQDGNPFTLVAMPDPGLSYRYLTSDDDMWFFLSDFIDPPNGLPAIKDYDPDGGYMISAGTYINYVVTNELVLVSSFGLNDGRDEEAQMVLQKAYPARTVIGMPQTDAINYGGGGMHCITMHRPK